MMFDCAPHTAASYADLSMARGRRGEWPFLRQRLPSPIRHWTAARSLAPCRNALIRFRWGELIIKSSSAKDFVPVLRPRLVRSLVLVVISNVKDIGGTVETKRYGHAREKRFQLCIEGADLVIKGVSLAQGIGIELH